MKSIFSLIIILIFQVTNTAQDLRLGGSLDFLLANKYKNYEIGPGIIFEYSFKDIPFSIIGAARFHLSELSEDNKFSFSYAYTVTTVGTSIKYSPVRWAIQPYISGGIFYNFNDTKSSGNPTLYNGKLFALDNLRNNISFEIAGGLKLSANSPINFIVEFTRTFNKPNYDFAVSDPDNNLSSKVIKFNFDSLFLSLGLLFML